MQKKSPFAAIPIQPKQRPLFLVAALALILLIGLLVSRSLTPERSVVSYCKIYQQEKARLAALPGDTWPSGVFNLSISDAGAIAASFSKLYKVAPKEIEPDVKTLRQLYAKIDADPSQAIAASLSGAAIDDSLATWTQQHCKIN